MIVTCVTKIQQINRLSLHTFHLTEVVSIARTHFFTLTVTGNSTPVVFGRRRGLIPRWRHDWLTRVSEEGVLEVEDVGRHHI